MQLPTIRRDFLMSLLALAFLSLCCNSGSASEALRFELNGDTETILPLGYTSRTILGVKRNGYLLETQPGRIKNPTVLPRFKPMSQGEMRGALLREFGKSFEVTGTGSFLIVHPRGARDLWANRFEDLYRSMVHFFKTRGFPMKRPQFPLVGVVFYSRSQYIDYCRRVLKENASSTYGLYTPMSNRIYLFDATMGSGSKSAQWEENIATVMHEAAHQTAFNTGIHQRGALTPAWMAEGLGCLFEARGIYNSFSYKNQKDRINRGRLADYRRLVGKNAASLISSYIASDKSFRSDPARGYATAWALTFYLSERQPRDYIRYLKTVAKREPFQPYSQKQRILEFTRVFGRDFRMLANRINQFVEKLPVQ